MVHGTESAARTVRRYEHGYNGFQGVDSPAATSVEVGQPGKDDLPDAQLLSSDSGHSSSGTKSAKQDGNEDEAEKPPVPLPKTNMVHGTESAARTVRRYEHGYNGFQGVDSPAATSVEVGQSGKDDLPDAQLLSSDPGHSSSGTK